MTIVSSFITLLAVAPTQYSCSFVLLIHPGRVIRRRIVRKVRRSKVIKSVNQSLVKDVKIALDVRGRVRGKTVESIREIGSERRVINAFKRSARSQQGGR